MLHLPRVSVILGLAIAAGCAGVSPRPEAATAATLPQVELSAAQSKRLSELVDTCVQTVVMRRYDEAERAAHSAIAIEPRCARARAVLGMVMLQRARLQDPADLMLANGGEAETRLAEQLAPEDPFVGWMRAVFLAESGHISAAAAAADEALARTTKATPEARAALLGVAGTYRYELGEERAARPLLQEYLSIRPEDAAANFRLGSCLLRIAAVPMGPKEKADLIAQNSADDAARAFARSFELAPGDEDAALAVGTAWLRAAELAEARRDTATRDQRLEAANKQFEQVATLFPNSAEVMFRLGLTAERRGDRAAAEAAYGKALEREAQHLGALLNFAALLEDGKGQEGAPAEDPRTPQRVRELLQRALEADARRPGLTDSERTRIVKRLKGA